MFLSGGAFAAMPRMPEPQQQHSMDELLMPSEEDLLYEEELLRNPYSFKMWSRYIEARKSIAANRRYVLYERALRALPGSYKVRILQHTSSLIYACQKLISDLRILLHPPDHRHTTSMRYVMCERMLRALPGSCRVLKLPHAISASEKASPIPRCYCIPLIIATYDVCAPLHDAPHLAAAAAALEAADLIRTEM